jgi:hypothetical protein
VLLMMDEENGCSRPGSVVAHSFRDVVFVTKAAVMRSIAGGFILQTDESAQVGSFGGFPRGVPIG